jgi:spore germination protein
MLASVRTFIAVNPIILSISLIISGTVFITEGYLTSGNAELDIPSRQTTFRVAAWTFPWDRDSFDALQRWYSSLDEVSPYWYWVYDNGSILKTHKDSEDPEFISFCNEKGIDIIPMVSNNHDPEVVTSICRNKSVQDRHISGLLNLTKKNPFTGLDINYESIKTQDRDVYSNFINNLSARMHSQGKTLSVSVFPKVAEWEYREGPDGYDYEELSIHADQIRVMAYNLHWSSCPESGPIESYEWVDDVMEYSASAVSSEKLILGIPQFSYDWRVDKNGRTLSVATNRTYNEVMKIMEEYNAPRKWDSVARTPFVDYKGLDGYLHSIHYCDRESVYHELKLVQKYRVHGISFWKIGGEDSATPAMIAEMKGRNIDDLPPFMEIGKDLNGNVGTPIPMGPVTVYDIEGIISAVEWNFGDGNTSNELDAVHTFTSGGFYTVTLKAFDDGGNGASMSKEVRIGPYAVFEVDGIPSVGERLKFNGTHSWDINGLISFNWDLGDGSYMFHDEPVVEHIYERPGRFDVVLTVINAEGYVDSQHRTVIVPDDTSPVADAGPDMMIWEDNSVELDALSSRDDSGVCQYSWRISTGEVFSEAKPVLYLRDPTILTATLTVADPSGNTDMDTMNITVRDRTPPMIAIEHPGSAPLGTSVEFDASGSSDNVAITQFIWDMGGGFTVKDRTTVELELKEAKRHFVTLEVLDAEGNWNSTTVFVDCIDVTPPKAELSVLPSPVPIDDTYMKNGSDELKTIEDVSFLGAILRNESYLFSVSGVIDDTGIGSILWTFGDGSIAGGPITYHSYKYSGLYIGSVELSDLFNNSMVMRFSLLVLPSYEISIIEQEKENITYVNTTTNVRPERMESPLFEIESIILIIAGTILVSMFVYESARIVNSTRKRKDGQEKGGSN